MSNYCLPIQKKNKDDVMRMIDKHEDVYNSFEVWLDLIEEVDTPFLSSLISRLGDRLVVVFRQPSLEQMRLPLKKRLAFLEELSHTDAYVDLDIQSQTEELDHITEHQLEIKSIISYHNYTHTPPDQDIYTLVETALEEREPTVIKVATMCQREEDALRLLQLLLFLRARGHRAIILGMGKYGVITRIFGSLWGNELSFAPEGKTESSAPGQLTRHQLEKILKEIKE